MPSQLWNTSMFCKDIIRPINAVTGGLDNMGMGFALLIMSELFERIKLCGANQYLAWKLTVVLPSFVTLLTGK